MVNQNAATTVELKTLPQGSLPYPQSKGLTRAVLASGKQMFCARSYESPFLTQQLDLCL
jgi:hypothetical protein